MQRCEFCGSDLPVNAHFCGNCGRLIPDGNMTATDITYPPETGIPAPQTPPLFSSPSYQTIQDTEMGWEGTDATFRTRWSAADMESVNQQFADRRTDENEAVLPDLLFPGMPAMPGQLPSSAQAPMVPGTPQVGGVPSVPGTPVAPGNAPLSIQGQGFAHGAGSSAPSSAPEVPQSPPIHQQPVQHAGYEPAHHHYQPVHHGQHNTPSHELEHQHHHRDHTGPLRDHRQHSSRLHRSATVTSKAGMRVASRWLIVALTAIIVIGSTGIILAHALMPGTPPALTVIGANVVRDGGILRLHGKGFQPGDSITLTIDNGLQVSLAGQHGTQDISQGTQRSVNVSGLSQMFIAGALQPRSVAAPSITVSSSGTFDVNVTVPLSLLAGKHTIRAVDNQGSQSASMQFTVPSPELAVNPTALDFGSIEVGRTVKLSVTVSNRGGGSRLHWTASVGGSNTNWLTLPNSIGVIETNGSDETITVTANTNGLSKGPHSATLRIHSDNSDVQIAVKINVIPIAQSGQQAILNVPQQNLDFGQLQAGQQAQQSISIADLGNLPLKWQGSSDAASAGWLSLDTTSGTVQTGAAPQTVQVTVNSTGLAAGSYTGTINITSNGGNETVTVTFGVTAVTPTPIPTTAPATTPPSPPPTPTPSPPPPTPTPPQPTPTPPTVTPTPPTVTPTPPPPIWSVNPTKLTNLDGKNCSGGTTWTCTVTLREDASSQVDIIWTSSSDQKQVIFSPASGTLSPGKSVQVTVSSIPCSHTEFNFTGSGGAQPLTALWDCSQTPSPTPQPPILTVNASGNCPPDTNGNSKCTDTLTITGSQGSISWSVNAESDLPGTTFNPQSGTLSAGQSPQQVIVTIPRGDCPAGGHYDYSWTGSHSSRVTFTCTSPTPTPQPQPTPTPQPQPTPTPQPQPTPTPQPQPTPTPQPQPTPTPQPQPTPTPQPQPTPTPQPQPTPSRSHSRHRSHNRHQRRNWGFHYYLFHR